MKQTDIPAPDATDETRPVDADETRREGLGSTAPTVQGATPHAERTTSMDGDEDRTESLEDKIRRRLSESDSDDTKRKADPLIGREIAGRFSIESKIGAGGMGAVYRARQRGMDRDVAIKVLLRELTENETVLRRFHIEALAVSKLRHPNTIQIFDFGETEDGLLYIAMEFLEGKPLQKVLRDEQELSVHRALKITAQIAKSLREAHSKGIVHRDLKPDNVILESVGEESDFVKVLDFGVAKVAEGDGQQKTLTKAGSIFGTPKYMSPEQSRGGDIDARSDIYSIGVLLYEMLIGRVPFVADNPLGILIKHIQEHPPALQTLRPDLVVPEAVEDLVMRLLAKDPAKRPQTAEAVIREIEELQKGLPELFRNVVTREDAERAGIEISTASRTALNTDLAPLADTVGPFADKTVLGAPSAPRRRWPLILMGALVILLGGAGVIYASLDQLPREYVEFTAIGDEEIGTVPEFDLESVFLTLVSTPLGADILDEDGNVIGQTPHTLRRTAGAPSESYTFRLDDYEDYARSFSFEKDDTVTVALTEKPKEKPDRPVATKPVTTHKPVVADKPTTTDKPVVADKPTTTDKPVATDKPVDFNPTKVNDTKPTPYDYDPKKVKDTKPDPYGSSKGKGTKSSPY